MAHISLETASRKRDDVLESCVNAVRSFVEAHRAKPVFIQEVLPITNRNNAIQCIFANIKICKIVCISLKMAEYM